MAPPPPATRAATASETSFLLTMIAHTTGGSPNGLDWGSIARELGTDDVYGTIARFDALQKSLRGIGTANEDGDEAQKRRTIADADARADGEGVAQRVQKSTRFGGSKEDDSGDNGVIMQGGIRAARRRTQRLREQAELAKLKIGQGKKVQDESKTAKGESAEVVRGVNGRWREREEKMRGDDEERRVKRDADGNGHGVGEKKIKMEGV